jgi:hypothetical protein
MATVHNRIQSQYFQIGNIGDEDRVASMPNAQAMSDSVTIEAAGSTATIHKLGATVISWQIDGKEKLFVRWSSWKMCNC